MAFVMEFGTGFETGQVPTRAGVFSGGRIATSPVHDGMYALRVISGSWVLGGEFAAGSEKYVAHWGAVETGTGQYFRLHDASGNILVAFRRNGLYLDAYVGSTKVASGTVAFDDTYHHMQMHVKVDNSAGIIETIIDGIPDISYSGDTQPAANADIAQVAIAAGGGYGWFVDNFALGYGGWPGDIRFDAVLLDGDDTVAWTPSTGTDNYALLDEVPPSSTDYVSTTVDASDLYTLAPWDDTDGSGNVVKDPIAVTLWASARKEDGNYNDLLRLNMQDGGNTVTGDYETLLTSYEHRWLLRMAAPDGGEWTKAKIDDLLVGIDADME